MDTTLAFVLYVTVFRLSIIAAAIVSLILGYKLFVKGVWPEGKGGSGLEASIAGQSFNLKNAAPGTFFALFGVLIISLMFAAGVPELKLETITRPAGTSQTVEGVKGGAEGSADLAGAAGVASNAVTSSTLMVRGSSSIEQMVEEGKALQKQGDAVNAMAVYRKALEPAAEPLNQLAWLHYQRDELPQARALSQAAVELNPVNANYLDTLSDIALKSGDRAMALKWMEEAARLQPKRYGDKLEKLRAVP